MMGMMLHFTSIGGTLLDQFSMKTSCDESGGRAPQQRPSPVEETGHLAACMMLLSWMLE